MIGHDRDDWHRSVSTYQEVVYQNLWHQIDLRFYFTDTGLKYDFEVLPGGEPSSICLRYEGIESMEIDGTSGDLVLMTSLGAFKEPSPCSYVRGPFGHREVACEFVIDTMGRVGLEPGDWDRDYELIIDPGLNLSTYIGGGLDDFGARSCVYSEGTDSIYIAASSLSEDFPTTAGAYEDEKNTDFDIVVLCLDYNGSNLRFSTFIGGGGDDWAYSLEVDDEGRPFLTGFTYSNDFPTTSGAFDRTLNGTSDSFILKLEPDGSDLVFSTYVGGAADEMGYDISIDDDGNPYVGGITESLDFPTSSRAYDRLGANGWTGFILKMEPDGTDLVYSTYFGGLGTEILGLFVDEAECAYVTGATESPTFPTSTGAYDSSLDGRDAFVAKLSNDGSNIEYSTLVGGTSSDQGKDVTVDRLGCAYITGDTTSRDFPTSPTGYLRQFMGGSDAFVCKLKANGTGLVYGTYLGGSESDAGTKLLVDDGGCAYVIIEGDSPDVPITTRTFDRSSNGRYDGIFFKLNERGTAPVYSTFLGGRGVEFCRGLDLDHRRCVLITGSTSSPDFPTTGYAFDDSHNEAFDVFITRLDIDPPAFGEDRTPGNISAGSELTFNITVTDNLALGDVFLEVMLQDSYETKNMRITSGDVRNGTWSVDINISIDRVSTIMYYFQASDVTDNVNTTEVKTIEVNDLTSPEIFDQTPSEATTGDPLTFVFGVRDNIAVGSVNLTYWHKSNPAERHSVEWHGPNRTEGAWGVYEHLIVIPSNSVDDIQYQLFAVDIYGNRNQSTVRTVSVTDDDVPGLVGPYANDTATTGDPYNIGIEAIDNIGIFDVRVTYWFEDEEPIEVRMEPVRVQGLGNGTYGIDIPIPPDDLSTLYYHITAVDLNGNSITCPTKTVSIVDDDDPLIGGDQSDKEAIKGLNFTFRVDATDNIGVWEVVVTYSTDGAAERSLSMDEDGTYTMTVTIPRDTYGSLHYTFACSDVHGNWCNSSWISIPLSNPAPEIDQIPIWYVHEIINETYDISSFVTDRNDPLYRLTLSCDCDRVNVDGFVLEFESYESYDFNGPIQFEFTINVSDGEEYAEATIEVVVTLFNDPPHAPFIILPVNGTSVPSGFRVVFEATYYDPDRRHGQRLEVTWTSNITGELATFDYSDASSFERYDLPPGIHLITVRISDGEFTNSSTTVVEVVAKEGPDEPDDGGADPTPNRFSDLWWIALAIFILFVAGTSALMVRKKYGQGD